MLKITGTYTDQYQLTMGQAYFLKGSYQDKAVFDYFFRKLPFSGGYAVFSGLQDLLTLIHDLRFDAQDLDYLYQQGFHADYLDYLKKFSFGGSISACQEGEIIFPGMPVLTVEATLLEAQLIETLLLNVLNFQSLIASKACRIRHVAGKRQLIDFGLRRAQGPGGYYASRAAMVGGFDASSNVLACRDYQIPVSGTMAHAFVQSYDDELSAFRDFAEIWPDNCILLVDTYDTLKSGVPNAIKVAKELADKGHTLKGIRLDSGDLAYLSKTARKMLDEAGLQSVKIAASNQLDEYVVKSLLEQGAPIDVFGVGTNLVIGAPDAALDGVYKLAFAHDKPRIKLSESIKKVTLPYKKQVYRLLDTEGRFIGADVVALADEPVNAVKRMLHPFEENKALDLGAFQKEALLKPVMQEGQRISAERSLQEINDFRAHRFALLSDEYKRFSNPHIYKVGLSEKLKTEQARLKLQHSL